MGISGLLPFVKSASKGCHISEFKGKTVAIDSYCWLHKGAFGCAEQLAKGEDTDAYVLYCFKYIDMLQTFRIKPIMVLDGRHLPAKAVTETKRREIRKQAKKRAVDYLKLGKLEEARSHFKRCIDITPEMAFKLIRECRRRNIDCIVAPYEADSQLAYLNRLNIVDFVISEDSDLLLFGCTKVIFKLDLTGAGTLVEAEKLHLATNERPEMFSFDRFRHMCILSGCDYVESLPGVGIKKALKFLKKHSNSDIFNSIVKLPSTLNMQQLTVTEEYRNQFMIADATFRHQLVFDPLKRCLLPLTDPNVSGTNPEYCCNAGEILDKEIAYQIALGNLNPFTLEVLDNWSPEEALKSRVNPTASIWSRSYKLRKSKSPETKRARYSPTKNKNIEYKIEIIESTQDDDKFEETLLKLYESPEPNTKRLCVRPFLDNSDKKEEKTVILAEQSKLANPFIKTANSHLIKKLSKFERTVMDETSIVTSKFFSSQSSIASSTISSETCSQSEVEEPVYNNDDSPSSGEAYNTTGNEVSQCNDEECDIVEVLENTSYSGTHNNLVLKDERENLINDEQLNTKKPNLPNNTITVLNKFKYNNTIKTKMQTCRPPGLSKKFSKFANSKNQPTLLSMFAFKKS